MNWRWGWDGRNWIPDRSRQPNAARAARNVPATLLVFLLVLDLVGFVPGVSLLTSVMAAGVLLAIDGRGLVTLNGLIKWRRMTFRLMLVVALLAVVLFQFVVLVYLAQRLFGMATGAVGQAGRAKDSRIPGERATVASTGEADLGGVASATPLDADAIRRELDALLAEAGNRLPNDLTEQVRGVVSAIDDVLPAYRASGLDPHDRFVVERTASDYLPSAVRRYLKLPVAYRSTPLPELDGKTASQVLSDQLDLLIQRMRQVAEVAYRKDLDALLVHGRFLHSKFGASSLSLRR